MTVASLPTDAKERKGTPIATGVLDYFPLALAEVARVSKAGNEQHNPGQPLHWAKDKSTDHADCIVRHLIDRGTLDSDGQRHSAKVAWRALALLQIELENAAAEPQVEKVHVDKGDVLFVYQVLNSPLKPEDTTPERFKLWSYAVENREEFLNVLVPAATKDLPELVNVVKTEEPIPVVVNRHYYDVFEKFDNCSQRFGTARACELRKRVTGDNRQISANELTQDELNKLYDLYDTYSDTPQVD